ncbi:MAG: transporter substrate-binding domain-containing protein [Xanthobacteraceae bacterium]
MRRFAAFLIASLACVAAPASADELAPTGTLRATFIATNPVQAVTDAQTGEVRGPAAELTRELARRLGIPFTITGAQGVPGVLESVKTGKADIGFLAFDPQRAVEVDFSQPYSLAQNTYVVLEGSPIRSGAEIDRPGLRIGATTRDAGELFLTRTLKAAELIRNPGGNLDVAVRQLKAGEIDAYATNRQRLSELVARTPGLRLLPDNFYAVEQSIIVAKGNPGLPRIDRFLDEARASGLIAAAIARAGLAGVDVAPRREAR